MLPIHVILQCYNIEMFLQNSQKILGKSLVKIVIVSHHHSVVVQIMDNSVAVPVILMFIPRKEDYFATERFFKQLSHLRV